MWQRGEKWKRAQGNFLKNMKNKTLALCGIGTYILGVIASVEDLEGNFVSPVALIVISGIATLVFIVMATIHLWKGAKYVSIMLVSSTIILCTLTVIQEVTLPQYGSPIIILLNVTKVIDFLIFFLVITKLFKMKEYDYK